MGSNLHLYNFVGVLAIPAAGTQNFFVMFFISILKTQNEVSLLLARLMSLSCCLSLKHNLELFSFNEIRFRYRLSIASLTFYHG